jgi:hypothetical protein
MNDKILFDPTDKLLEQFQDTNFICILLLWISYTINKINNKNTYYTQKTTGKGFGYQMGDQKLISGSRMLLRTELKFIALDT